ncbi:flagellar assembly protein FliH [Effusibacillus dendaii]|uniref:Flagellar assembly protein FliH n=1 Tax=Effusibacillus dendaii TaxID=2743772 RepID=A0A7I8D9Q6_9BACL|nr:flagellar assembly protein FliH [Effusibacillus dendaii]BCJ85260.1 hypothetical protein skT53_02450 [Effusibacillus dendaii]
MSKIVKSFYATVNGQRRIDTIPVVTYVTPPVSGTDSTDTNDCLPVALTPEELLQEAKEQAEKILSDARTEAERILREAADQAETIRLQAKAQAEQLLDDSRREGVEQGVQEGRFAAQAEYQEQVEHLLQLIRQTEEDRQQYLLQTEPQLLQLACEIARKIIGQELATDPGWIENTVKAAIAELVDRSVVELYVHPEDAVRLLDKKDDLIAQSSGKVNLQIHADPTIEKGGCVLRTPLGTVDGRIDTQLQEVKQALLEAAATRLP